MRGRQFMNGARDVKLTGEVFVRFLLSTQFLRSSNAIQQLAENNGPKVRRFMRSTVSAESLTN